MLIKLGDHIEESATKEEGPENAQEKTTGLDRYISTYM